MFGFDAPSGIEVTEYESKISDEDAVRSAFGQGTNTYYPAQIARYNSFKNTITISFCR